MKFNPVIKVGNKIISENSPVYIIAEAGVNHGGDTALAKKLVDVAVEAGADAVKFQAFRAESLILENVGKAPYQTKTTEAGESQFQMLRSLELKREQYRELKKYCDSRNILFLITPFDEQSLEELDELDLDAYKIASTDTTNLPFLKKVARRGKPIFLSTGMSYLPEVQMALAEMHPLNENVVLLACTANYPITDDEANLRTINTFRKSFDVLVGYSDHSVGVGAAPYAVPMGAVVIEKHFTLDKGMKGPDHLASLNPDELKDLVKQIRQIEVYLGTAEKIPTISEHLTRQSLQKCLVAARPIKSGQVIGEDDLVAKRTGGQGISPVYYHRLVGRKAARDFNVNDILTVE